MTRRANGRVFLSASFPTDERFTGPYDVTAIADAVAALARAVFRVRWRLVFGGHPTISPLVLLVAREVSDSGDGEATGVAEIYQSRYFEQRIPGDTADLVDEAFGHIHMTPAAPDGDRNASLATMRQEMIGSGPFAAAVFIGGMDGIREEYEMFAERWPAAPRLPLWAPGGVARGLPPSPDLPDDLAAALRSDRYPAVAHTLVSALESAG